MMLLMVAGAAVAGPVTHALGNAGSRGEVGPGIFGAVVIVVGLLLRPVFNDVETLVFGVKQRPWLGGRLKRWQKLVLPFQTGYVVSTGLSTVMFGGAYLLSATPGWSVPNEFALAAVALGGLLMGFGTSRLFAGALIVYVSGLWSAPKWAWRIGIAVIVMSSLANAAWSVHNATSLVPWM